MDNTSTPISIQVEMTDDQELILLLETFLKEHYRLRRNTVRDIVEFKSAGAEDFLPLTDVDFNTIVLEARKEGIEGSVRKTLQEIINSNFVEDYDPAKDYLRSLPEWDGKDRVEPLFNRIPGITAEQVYYASRWIHSVVAHWLGKDSTYGNQTVLTLIGAQGCGKSTFAKRLLPESLQDYYLDHLNLSNKFDKEMALSNSMIVNIDEIDQVTASQQAQLKQTITKSNVNGRKIYGRTMQNRRRVASFIATTNNPHPLKDPTGSRRYLCIKVADDCLIDNITSIDYDQLYAQILHELEIDKMPYWFNEEETRRIQQLNARFYANVSIEQMIENCIRRPEEGEISEKMSSSQILQILSSQYPGVQNNRSWQTRLGATLTQMGFVSHRGHSANTFDVVKKVVA